MLICRIKPLYIVALLRTTHSQDINNRLEIHELKLARGGNLVKHLTVAHLTVAVLNVAPVSTYQK